MRIVSKLKDKKIMLEGKHSKVDVVEMLYGIRPITNYKRSKEIFTGSNKKNAQTKRADRQDRKAKNHIELKVIYKETQKFV